MKPARLVFLSMVLLGCSPEANEGLPVGPRLVGPEMLQVTEQSQVQFVVSYRDESGAPVAGQRLVFSINGEPGGAVLEPESETTDADGTIRVLLKAGNPIGFNVVARVADAAIELTIPVVIEPVHGASVEVTMSRPWPMGWEVKVRIVENYTCWYGGSEPAKGVFPLEQTMLTGDDQGAVFRGLRPGRRYSAVAEIERCGLVIHTGCSTPVVVENERPLSMKLGMTHLQSGGNRMRLETRLHQDLRPKHLAEWWISLVEQPSEWLVERTISTIPGEMADLEDLGAKLAAAAASAVCLVGLENVRAIAAELDGMTDLRLSTRLEQRVYEKSDPCTRRWHATHSFSGISATVDGRRKYYATYGIGPQPLEGEEEATVEVMMAINDNAVEIEPHKMVLPLASSLIGSLLRFKAEEYRLSGVLRQMFSCPIYAGEARRLVPEIDEELRQTIEQACLSALEGTVDEVIAAAQADLQDAGIGPVFTLRGEGTVTGWKRYDEVENISGEWHGVGTFSVRQ
jgi:hypothetical protein